MCYPFAAIHLAVAMSRIGLAPWTDQVVCDATILTTLTTASFSRWLPWMSPDKPAFCQRFTASAPGEKFRNRSPGTCRRAAVADLYSSYLRTTLANPAVIALLTWGITDRSIWLNHGVPARTACPSAPCPSAPTSSPLRPSPPNSSPSGLPHTANPRLHKREQHLRPHANVPGGSSY